MLDSFLRGSTAEEELVMSAVTKALPDKDLFYTLSGKPAFSDEYTLSVPIIAEQDISHLLIELAFRYLAKVITSAYCNSQISDPFENCIAYRSLESFKWKLSSEYFNEISQRFDYATMRLTDYIESGNDSSENIVQQCWFLAKLDVCYRRGAVPSDVGQFFQPATVEEYEEVFNMALKFRKSFIPKVIKPQSRVIFNPYFGFGESLVGETDCDMIIDHTIVDLRGDLGYEYPVEKVSKSYLHYILAEINRRYGDTDYAYKVDNLAFYSGRYGETEVLSLEDTDIAENEKAIDKVCIATGADQKRQSIRPKSDDDFSPQEFYPRKEKETFLDRYNADSEREEYNDGYNQVVKKKHRHIFQKFLIFIIIISLFVVAFYYGKDWYTQSYGNDYSLDAILHNLFGLDL